VRQVGDRVFARLAQSAGVLILVVLAGVAVFLVAEALPAITAASADLPGGQNLVAYIAPLVFGTVLSAGIALVVATPLAVGVALFITHFAPPRVSQTLGYLVDLLAAVPSIVYGLWGAAVLGPASVGFSTWANEWLGWLPFFAGPVSARGGRCWWQASSWP
jgi:phosphate transport system permease protein